jgi:hypothetical protein
MLLVTLVLLLVICAGTYVGLATWSRHERRQLGLRDGRVTAADDSRLGSATLRSERLGLVARPDHVLDVHGMRIPVEQKPSAQRVWPSHTLQVSAQCPCSKRRLACDRRTRCWCSRTGSSKRSRLRPSESKSCSTRCSRCATSWNRGKRQDRAGRAASAVRAATARSAGAQRHQSCHRRRIRRADSRSGRLVSLRGRWRVLCPNFTSLGLARASSTPDPDPGSPYFGAISDIATHTTLQKR